jgi:glycosyltransferase involved in cell wall biosynthesis
MNVVGMIRCKNESRWIDRVIESILPLCSRVFVFDDNSTDGTPDICRSIPRVTVIESEYCTLDESRDKNALLGVARVGADWIIHIDGDEVLTKRERLYAIMSTTKSVSLALPVLYLWNREDRIRVDGVYGKMSRASVFRPGNARFEPTGNGGNFHCGNVPHSLLGTRQLVDSPLLHFGYQFKADRIRKYEFYNRTDPANDTEGRYLHVVQGDVPESPESAILKHAGPLRLVPLSDYGDIRAQITSETE